ncbi:unnamed protein product [Lactuca virosa]|uniref:Uncharacterized protein n=1 Tax=Lactuca virosa TaxID=75947 RepID=A0AAU9PG77_9ASTR|nr:unnamed protein product [Lactuca virosa]
MNSMLYRRFDPNTLKQCEIESLSPLTRATLLRANYWIDGYWSPESNENNIARNIIYGTGGKKYQYSYGERFPISVASHLQFLCNWNDARRLRLLLLIMSAEKFWEVMFMHLR